MVFITKKSGKKRMKVNTRKFYNRSFDESRYFVIRVVVMVHRWTASVALVVPWWWDVRVHANDWFRIRCCAFHRGAPAVIWWRATPATHGIITVRRLGRHRRHRPLRWAITVSRTDARHPYVRPLRLNPQWWTAAISGATRGSPSYLLPSETTAATTIIRWRLQLHRSNDCSIRPKDWGSKVLRAMRSSCRCNSNNSGSHLSSSNIQFNNNSRFIMCNIRTTMPNWRAWRIVCPI